MTFVNAIDKWIKCFIYMKVYVLLSERKLRFIMFTILKHNKMQKKLAGTHTFKI